MAKTLEIIRFDDEFIYIRDEKIKLTPKIRKELGAIVSKSNRKMLDLLLHGSCEKHEKNRAKISTLFNGVKPYKT